MVVFPHAKINLGLRITGRRTDGYHDIQTLFYPIPLNDVLEIVENTQKNAQPFEFICTGSRIPGTPGANLCEKAFHLVKKLHPDIPPTILHLHKAIPAGGGLGGGSSDGTLTLQLLNNYYRLGINESKLHALALQLGSDCPFFLNNQPCIGTGRGELLQPVSFSLKGFALMVVNPGIAVSTAEAFKMLKRYSEPIDLEHVIQHPPGEWKNILVNDFEAPVFHVHPALYQIKETLYHSGALYASLSGTGSTLYGIFNNQISIPTFEAKGYFVKWLE